MQCGVFAEQDNRQLLLPDELPQKSGLARLSRVEIKHAAFAPPERRVQLVADGHYPDLLGALPCTQTQAERQGRVNKPVEVFDPADNGQLLCALTVNKPHGIQGLFH